MLTDDATVFLKNMKTLEPLPLLKTSEFNSVSVLTVHGFGALSSSVTVLSASCVRFDALCVFASFASCFRRDLFWAHQLKGYLLTIVLDKMNRRFQGRRCDGHTQRVETRTYAVVQAHVPVLRYEIAEVVGSQFYGCTLQHIDNCDIQFAVLRVSALDEIQDTISDMKRTIDKLTDDVEAARGSVNHKDVEMQNRIQENEHLSMQIAAMTEELGSVNAAYEQTRKESVHIPEIATSLQSLQSEVALLKLEILQKDNATEKKSVDISRQNKRNWTQLKRLLHDIKRVPRRRRNKQAEKSVNETNRKLTQRRCYKCRQKGHQARECPLTISEDNAMKIGTPSALDVTSFSMLDKAEDETITLNADELQKNAEWYKRVTESSPAQFVIRDGDVGIRLLPLSSDSSALTTESDND